MTTYEHFFCDDVKMHDYYLMTKEDFLKSYSYLTEKEHETHRNKRKRRNESR